MSVVNMFLWNVLTKQLQGDHANVRGSCPGWAQLLVIDFLPNNGEDGACYGLPRPTNATAFLSGGVNTVGVASNVPSRLFNLVVSEALNA